MTDQAEPRSAPEASEANLQAVTDNAPVGIVVVQDDRWVFVNRFMTALVGRTVADLRGASLLEQFHPDDRGRMQERYRRRLAGEDLPRRYEALMLGPDGMPLPVEINAARTSWNGRPATMIFVADIRARRHAEAAMRESEYRFKSAFENSPIGMALVSAEGRWTKVNRRLCEMLGYEESELLELDALTVTHPEDRAATESQAASIRDGSRETYRMEKRYVRKDRSSIWALVQVAAVLDASGHFVQAITQVEDITERRSWAERIEHLALHDPLTGLPNRRLLADRLHQALTEAKRSRSVVGLLYLDLDGFKPVNDALGHAAGDALLREIADRLRGALRETDTVSRTGGDEFVVLLPGAGARTCLESMARRLLHAIEPPHANEFGVARVSASIGAASYPENGADAEELLRAADAAMYVAKQSGRGQLRFA